jgi:hypothetical protein
MRLEVTTLVNEQKEMGSYRAQWKPDVPSGVYFYQRQVRPLEFEQANETILTEKMIVAR